MNRVARLMKQEALKAQVGYNRPRYKGGKVAILADNHLKQDFDVQQLCSDANRRRREKTSLKLHMSKHSYCFVIVCLVQNPER
jgi:hypothetical protein